MKVLFYVSCQLFAIIAFAQKVIPDTSIIGITSISISDTLWRPVETRFISGQVKDPKTDVGVPGATVVVKRTSKTTITDKDGKFKISMSRPENTLQFLMKILILL